MRNELTSARRTGQSSRAGVPWASALMALAALMTWADTGPALAAGEVSIAEPVVPHTAAWPFFRSPRRAVFESSPESVTPHPAVARIIVSEQGATAFGSGTLVDNREQYGLVVTNWHVVRDSQGVVEVVFPNGFRSQARPLKVDSDWDLAALVIWRPPIEAVKLAPHAPRPGDLLTIHGYGQGQYRIATGRCTNYYAPAKNFPTEMVELDVEARQGDSGGPIFNQNGELAGVLFGAGQGTTLGSFGPRVSSFLASLAPDIGQASDRTLVAVADRPAPNVRPGEDYGASADSALRPSSPWSAATPSLEYASSAATPHSRLGSFAGRANPFALADGMADSIGAGAPPMGATFPDAAPPIIPAGPSDPRVESSLSWQDIAANRWYDPAKSILALVGLAAIALQLIKAVA